MKNKIIIDDLTHQAQKQILSFSQYFFYSGLSESAAVRVTAGEREEEEKKL